MPRKVKFIHAADIHLGSILHISSKEYKELFNNATYKAFEKICNVALTEEIDFMVLSGDVYDRQARSVKANKFFIEQCKRLSEKGIMVYLIGGNHDPLTENSELFSLPHNVYIFSSEKVEIADYVNKQGNLRARILGQSYSGRSESRKLFERYIVPNDDVFNIALLHTQLDNSTNNYIPCTIEELKSVKHIHYWALGHIHRFNIMNKEIPVVAYPGIPQGRDLGECDLGGALLVEMQENKDVEIKFINTALVRFNRIEVSIEVEEPPKNLTELQKIIIKAGEKFIEDNFENCNNIKGYVIQWILTGRGDISNILTDREEEATEVLTEGLNDTFVYRDPFIVTDSIIIKTKKKLNYEDKDNIIYKELEELIGEFLNNEVLRKEIVNSFGGIWEENNDFENINEQKFQLDNEVLNMILNEAKELVLEKLLERTLEDEDKRYIY